MNVLVLTDNYPDTGNPLAGIFVREQLEGLIEGCKIKVVYPQLRHLWKGKKNGNLVHDPLRLDGIEFFRPTVPVFPKGDRLFLRGFLFFAAALKVFHALRKRHDVDLIHAHMACPSGFASVLLGSIYSIPVVLTVHGSDLHTYTKHRFLKWQVICTLKKASAIVAVSETLGRIARSHDVNDNKIRVINNGVNLEVFRLRDRVSARVEFGIEVGKRVALFVGRLEKVKRIDRLLESFQLLKKGMENAYLVIVGQGELEGVLKRQADELELRNQVLFAGSQDRTQVAKWMNAADVVCFTSENEGFPSVSLEAIASGKPVVAYAVGGLKEIVRHGENGILVEGNDPASYAEAMRYSLTQSWDKEQISQKAQKYSWKANTDKYLEVFESVKSEYKR